MTDDELAIWIRVIERNAPFLARGLVSNGAIVVAQDKVVDLDGGALFGVSWEPLQDPH